VQRNGRLRDGFNKFLCNNRRCSARSIRRCRLFCRVQLGDFIRFWKSQNMVFLWRSSFLNAGFLSLAFIPASFCNRGFLSILSNLRRYFVNSVYYFGRLKILALLIILLFSLFETNRVDFANSLTEKHNFSINFDEVKVGKRR